MTLLRIQWMSQISRFLQAFLIISSLMLFLVVESFVGGYPSSSSSSTGAFVDVGHHYHAGGRSSSVLAYSHAAAKNQDMSWNSTAMAMNAAHMAASSAPVCSFGSENTTTTTTGAEHPQQPLTVATTKTTENHRKFQPTVSHSTLDQWFHVLGGMEDERIVNRNSHKRGGLWGIRKTWSIQEKTPPTPPQQQRHQTPLPPSKQQGEQDKTSPSASPTPAPMPNNNNNHHQDPQNGDNNNNNKPTDHWMY